MMADLTMRLSTNFTLGELVRSDTAERSDELLQVQQNPSDAIIESLKHLAETTLQPIRDQINHAILINSGYRSPQVNELVGGSGTSQHVRGEAADCRLSPTFLTDARTAPIRQKIESEVKAHTGRPVRPGVSEQFYLFAYICLHLAELDVDQVIHEYGDGFGHPAWVHVSASRRQNRRQILGIGRYTNRQYVRPSLAQALDYGTSAQS
jgi:hypothetical protein